MQPTNPREILIQNVLDVRRDMYTEDMSGGASSQNMRGADTHEHP